MSSTPYTALITTKRNTAKWLEDQGDHDTPQLLRAVAEALEAFAKAPDRHRICHATVPLAFTVRSEMMTEGAATNQATAWKLPGEGLYLLESSGQIVYSIGEQRELLEYQRHGTDMVTTAFFNLAVERLNCWKAAHEAASKEAATKQSAA